MTLEHLVAGELHKFSHRRTKSNPRRINTSPKSAAPRSFPWQEGNTSPRPGQPTTSFTLAVGKARCVCVCVCVSAVRGESRLVKWKTAWVEKGDRESSPKCTSVGLFLLTWTYLGFLVSSFPRFLVSSHSLTCRELTHLGGRGSSQLIFGRRRDLYGFSLFTPSLAISAASVEGPRTSSNESSPVAPGLALIIFSQIPYRGGEGGGDKTAFDECRSSI